MLQFAKTAEAIGATSKKLEKTALVAAYFQTLLQTGTLKEAAIAAVFFTGRPFPAYEQMTLQVGGSLLWRLIGDLSGKSEAELSEIYRRHGDFGSVAAEALAATAKSHSGLSRTEVQQAYLQ